MPDEIDELLTAFAPQPLRSGPVRALGFDHRLFDDYRGYAALNRLGLRAPEVGCLPVPLFGGNVTLNVGSGHFAFGALVPGGVSWRLVSAGLKVMDAALTGERKITHGFLQIVPAPSPTAPPIAAGGTFNPPLIGDNGCQIAALPDQAGAYGLAWCSPPGIVMNAGEALAATGVGTTAGDVAYLSFSYYELAAGGCRPPG